MNFRFWKASAKSQKAPLLEVICPKIHNQKFPEMEKTIARAVEHAKRKMDSDGAPAAAILFSEGENFRFTITQEEGIEYAARVQLLLPDGYGIAVAFNLLESHGEYLICNNGYLVSLERILHSPKRNLTEFEAGVVGNTFLPALRDRWEARTRELEKSGEPFPGFDFGFDLRMEHRLCADVCAAPAYFEPQTITLVSADGNLPGYYNHLAANRMAVVTNDAAQPYPAICKRESQAWSMAERGDFHMLSVFENKQAAQWP